MSKPITNTLSSLALWFLISLAHGQIKPEQPAHNTATLNAVPQRTTQPYINLTGTAQSGEIISVRRNGLDAGHTEANADSDFSLHLDLLPGKNELTLVNRYDQPYTGTNNQQTVYYAPLPQTSAELSAPAPLTKPSSAPPVLILGNNITTANPAPVEGYADAGTVIQLFVNGRRVGETRADRDGLFQAEISLHDGANTLYATTSAGSEATLISNSMQLEYINPAPRSSSVGGTLTQSETWTTSGAPYFVTSNLIVPAGLTLTIQSGVEVRFSSSVGLQVAGTLNVQGTAIDPVILTTDDASPSINDWTGVTIQPGAVNVAVDHARIEWATRGLYFDGSTGTVTNSVIRNNQYGIFVSQNGSPVIDGGNEIINNNYGLFVTSAASTVANTLPVVRANIIHSNTFQNYYTRSTGTEAGKVTLDATGNWWGTTTISQIRSKIYDYSNSVGSPVVDFSGFLDAAGGMPAQTGAVLNGILDGQQNLSVDDYLVLGDLSVPSGDSLTIPAGTTLQFAAAGLALEVAGSLAVQGTSGAPATLTSPQPSVAGSWQGVILKPGAVAQINYLLLQAATNGIYVNGGSASISDSIIENTSGSGVYFLNSAVGSISHSVLRDNRYGVFVSHNCSPLIDGGNDIYSNDYGIYVSSIESTLATTMPVVRDNSLHTNAFYNYYARSSGTTAGNYMLDATGNWWGSTEVPTIRGKLYDHTDTSTSPVIDFSGFLDAAAGNEALSLYDVALSAHELHPLLEPAVEIQFILNTDATAQLEIVRESDNVVVFSSQIPLTAGAQQLPWGGRDNGAQIVDDGLYRARLSAIRDTETVTLDPSVPSGYGTVGLVDAFPAVMNPYRNEPFLLDLNVLEPVLISMLVTPDNGIQPFSYLVDSFLAPGVKTMHWDGRDPTGQIVDGQSYIFFPTPYKTRPYVIHITGAKPTLSDPLTAPSIAIKSDPYLITHSYEQISKITYRLDQDALVTFKLLPPGIYDPADTSAIILLNQQLQQAVDGVGQPLDHTVEWRGYQLTDTNQIMASTEGVYTFTIEATSLASGQSTLYRGALQIRQ